MPLTEEQICQLAQDAIEGTIARLAAVKQSQQMSSLEYQDYVDKFLNGTPGNGCDPFDGIVDRLT